MKNIYFLVFSLYIVLSLEAQNSKVVAAWKYLQDFYNVKDTSSLFSAKEAIDEAVVNESTKSLAKTWTYCGKIYQTLFEYKYQVEYDKRKEISEINKRVLDSYFNTNLDILLTCNDAYLMARKLDVKKAYEEDITPHFAECARHFENSASASYTRKDYAKALTGFEKAMELNSMNGVPDTTNMYNARVAAELLQNNEKAKLYYEKMLEYKVGKAITYHNYQYFLLNRLNDEPGAIAVIKKGRSAYPNDVMLINDETYFFLKSNNPDDADKAIYNLKLALEKAPLDITLNLALGNLYDRLANPKSAETGKDLPKPGNYNELLTNAEKYYLAAYTINNSDPIALFDLGALYNNKAKYMLDMSSEIKDEQKYKKAVKDANDILKSARPYLEAAYKLTPTDCAVILALKRLYFVIADAKEKYTEMDEKAKALGCR